MMKLKSLVCPWWAILAVGLAIGQTRKPPEVFDAHKGGPSITAKRVEGVAPHLVLTDMFAAMEKQWFPTAYESKQFLEYRVDLNADLPGSTMVMDGQPLSAGGTVNFDVNIDGTASPAGEYQLKMRGSLGEVQVTKDKHRTLVASEDFKSFSDSPILARSAGANLNNWRSYFLSSLHEMRTAVLEDGSFRSMYQGSGTYQGQEVDIVTVFKPRGALVANTKKGPISMNKIWTFWQDGAYEIWVYKVSKMPAVVFYSNDEDNIFSNFTIDYDKAWLPKRISYINNSANQEGSGDIVLTFGPDHLLTGVSLKYDGRKGISLNMSATLAFLNEVGKDSFRGIPPFGYRKLNRDHLKMMILTQISGGLLKLKKSGINLRNFKF